MKKYSLLKIVALAMFVVAVVGATNLNAQNCNLGTPSITPPAGITVFVGDDEEFSGLNNRGAPSMASRVALDGQDDSWRSSAVANSLTSINMPWTGGTGMTTSNTSSTPTNLFTHSGISVTAALHNVTNGNADCDGTINGNQGNLDNNDTLQDTAPRPQQFYVAGNQPRFFNENAGSSSNRNGIVFEFSTPVRAFGAWFGDLETRNDGMAQAAFLRLVDSSGNRIGNDIIIPPNGTPDESVCGGGGASTSPSACGNETTRWVGFLDSMMTPRISKAIIIVGDDDSGGNGNTQHLSFIGATIATLATTAADASVSGRIVNNRNRGVSRVFVTISNASTGEIKTAISNSFGYFRFTDLEVGDFYIMIVRHRSYQFENDTQSFQVFDNINDIVFVARNNRESLSIFSKTKFR